MHFINATFEPSCYNMDGILVKTLTERQKVSSSIFFFFFRTQITESKVFKELVFNCSIFSAHTGTFCVDSTLCERELVLKKQNKNWEAFSSSSESLPPYFPSLSGKNYSCVRCVILIGMHGALITLPAFISRHVLFITK